MSQLEDIAAGMQALSRQGMTVQEVARGMGLRPKCATVFALPPTRTRSYETWKLKCEQSLAISRERRASPHPFPAKRLGVLLGIAAAAAIVMTFLAFMGVATAAPWLSSERARAASLTYERAYWEAQRPGAVSRIERCRRRSPRRVVCWMHTEIREGSSTTGVSTTTTMTLERHGVVRVHPSQGALISTETTLE